LVYGKDAVGEQRGVGPGVTPEFAVGATPERNTGCGGAKPFAQGREEPFKQRVTVKSRVEEGDGLEGELSAAGLLLGGFSLLGGVQAEAEGAGHAVPGGQAAGE
jgi:hypothetical protein